MNNMKQQLFVVQKFPQRVSFSEAVFPRRVSFSEAVNVVEIEGYDDWKHDTWLQVSNQ